MKRLNRILIIFFCFNFITIYGGWRFIHSRKFSDHASQKVSEILTRKMGAKLSFTGVDFGIFPPSTIFKNVHIEKNAPDVVRLDLQIEELGVSFTYRSFFSSDLKIDDLILKNGNLSVLFSKKQRTSLNWKNLNIRKIFEEYSNLLSKSPVLLNAINVEKVKIVINRSSFMAKELSIIPHSRVAKLKILATDIHADFNNENFSIFDLNKVSAAFALTQNALKVESFHLVKGINEINTEANLFDQYNVIHINSNVKFYLDLENLLKIDLKLPGAFKKFKEMKGLISGTFKTSGRLLDPDVEVSILARQVKSPWVELEELETRINKKDNYLVLEKLTAKKMSEYYELLKPRSFFDIKKESLLRGRTLFSVRNAFTNTFLYSLKSTMETLKGYITGKVDVVWDGERVSFEINEKAQVKDFKLLGQFSKKSILQNDGFFLEKTSFSIDKNYKLSIDAKLIMPNSIVKASGEITATKLNISIKDSKVDMKYFGSVAGVQINGAGPTNVEIYGPLDNVKFDFAVDWNNFSIIDLNFGKVKSKFSLSLKDMNVNIHELEGVYNQSNFIANGLLGFGNDANMDLRLDFKNTNFTDAQEMYSLIFKNIKLPFQPEFNFSTSYRIRGGYSIEKLDIEGTVKGSDLKMLNEEAEQLALNFSLKNNLLLLSKIKIIKHRGEINSNVSINLGNNYTEMEGSLQGVKLNDFNFYKKLNLEYNGDLGIDFDGNGTTENFSARLKSKVTNPFIANIPASPSNAIIDISADEIIVNANLLAGKIKLESVVNFKSRLLSLKSNIETNEMREILGIIAVHNMTEEGISGKISARVNSQINIDTFAVKKLLLNVSQFNLKKGDVNIKVDPKYNSVFLDEGVVKQWDLKFTDGDDYLISRGRNIANNAIAFDQDFSIKASAVEFFTNIFEKTVGVIQGTAQVVIDKKIALTKFIVNGINNSMKIKNLPGAITEFNYTIVKKEDYFELTKVNGKYGGGDIKASGTFQFSGLYPRANIEYKIERSMIPLFKRSSLLVSSFGTITGEGFPYKLDGKVVMLHGEFLDDPAELTKNKKINVDNVKKYLPQQNDAEKKGYLQLNVAFETSGQIAIKNNLAEVYVKGGGQVLGNILNPEITAKVEVLPTVSKFKFKGHDFILSQGNVEIHDRGKTKNSELKFIGLARINDYDVKLDISGSIVKPSITLASEPILAQEDLLSLLTLGVTSDMSKNLESNDRKSVTTVSIGALLVDQLKINEDLNSSLGLKLSVLPEFKEDESSLIQGKSAVSDSSANKLKSATKIKINKQINKSVDVSVSSTVGGSIEQTREMNINYNVNKKISVEGVYEIKSSEEENTNTPNSIGADVKYKWSF